MSAADDSEVQGTPTEGEGQGSLRKHLRLIVFAWMFGAVWLYTTTGALLTSYAKLMNLSNFAFGLLAAVPFAAALAQLPTSYVIERFGGHKKLFIVAGVIHRALWVLVALIPWVFPQASWWFGLILCTFLSGLAGHVSNVIWYAWMGDLVPTRIRGRYFSRRAQIGQMIGFIVSLLIGWVLDRSEVFGPDVMLKTISAALALSALCGVMDFLFFLPVPPPRKHKPNPKIEIWGLIKQPLMDRNFRRFMGFTATLTFAVGYVGQFVWLYLFDVAKMTYVTANAVLVSIPLIVMMIAYPLWGKLIDRFGRKPVLVIAGLLIVNGSTPLIFVTEQHWWQGCLAIVLIAAAWPGVELANFNLLLGMSESMSGRRYGTAYVAIISVVTALAGILSGLFGGAIAEWLKDWHGTLFGVSLTYHGVLFLISGLLRFLALFWLIGLEDAKAHSTRATFRYLTGSIFSNIQQVAVVPVRMVVHLGKLTFKLNPMSQPTSKPKDKEK